MDAPDSACSPRSGLLEYASVFIKIAIGIAMIAGLLPQYRISQSVPDRLRVTAGQVIFPTLLPSSMAVH
jgi:hypothetical protein